MLPPLHAEPSPGNGPAATSAFPVMSAMQALPAALLAAPLRSTRPSRGAATPARPAPVRGRLQDPAALPADDGRLGRLLESAMRVLAVVVLLCLAAAGLGPMLAGRAWPEPPPAPHPFADRLDAQSAPAGSTGPTESAGATRPGAVRPAPSP